MGEAVNLVHIRATCRHNRGTGGRIQRGGLLCSMPVTSCEVWIALEQRVPSLVSLSLLMVSLRHLCCLAHIVEP